MTKGPKVGISLNIRNISGQELLNLAREADEAGLYAIGEGDAGHDCFALLSAMAAVTRQIKLIAAIATWTRTPVTFARACRTVDVISGGRFVLGIGSMPPNFNEDYHGIPYKKPLERMREYIELTRILWKATPSSPVNYEGQFYQVKGFRPLEPPPRPDLPILIGATRERMTQLTGEVADGVIFNSIQSVPWLEKVAVPALAEGARRAGRSLQSLDKGVAVYAVATDQPEELRATMRRVLAFYLSLPYGLEWLSSNGYEEEASAIKKAQARGDRKGIQEAISDRVVKAIAIVGRPEECREAVARYGSVMDWILLGTPAAFSPSEAVKAVRRLIQTFRQN